MSEKKYAVVVLAAGSSSRMGEPKQLLSYRNKNLLNHTIDEAKKAVNGIVVVILGGNYHLIAGNINHAGIKVIYNPDWAKGMSSSVHAGLQYLTKEYPQLDGVILTVCDQPFVSATVFDLLVAEADMPGTDIVASAYGGTLGTPVLFKKGYFSELMQLSGPDGAKMLLKKYKDKVAPVPFEHGEIDIDTMEDYAGLTQENK